MGIKVQNRKRDDGATTHAVKGIGGSTRHRGYFSEDNPYYDDMAYGSNNKDIDAAYAQAVEWEADRANLEEQRAYDRQVLEEQREYDSPLAQLQRQREAGYNPELAGSGSSSGSGSTGSSAQLAQREIADQDADVQYKSAYKDEELRNQRWSIGASYLSGLANMLTSVSGSISTLRELPSRIKLNTANADLASAHANEISSLLDGKKKNLNLVNEGLGISNQGLKLDNQAKILSNIISASDVLNPDSDISSLLTAAGVSEDDMPSYQSAFKEIMKDPARKAAYKRNSLANQQADVNRVVFTRDYMMRVAKLGAHLAEEKLNYDTIMQSIDNTIAGYLQDSDYAKDSADAQIVGVSNNLAVQEQLKKNLSRDATAFTNKLDALQKKIKQADDRYWDLLIKRADSWSGGKRLTTRETIELEYLEDAIPMMESLKTEELNSMWGVVNKLRRNNYLSNNASFNINGHDVVLQDLGIYYDEYVPGAKTSHDIAKDWTNAMLQALQAAATAYVGTKMATRPTSTGQVITDYNPSAKGGMIPTHQRTITNTY